MFTVCPLQSPNTRPIGTVCRGAGERCGCGHGVLATVFVSRNGSRADGTLRDLQFSVPIERSSWVALRILPSSHTNPIWVLVDGKPVRASRKSVEWCLKGVEQCWSQKERFFTEPELTRIAAIAQLIDSAYAWAVMKEHWALDGKEAGLAASQALAVLLGHRPPGPAPRTKSRKQEKQK